MNLQPIEIMAMQIGKLVIALCLSYLPSSALAYERIVSTTGNASEIIAELGLADKLVAVDTTSTIPSEVMRKKTKIGYRRQLSSEGILSMQPDLLILAPDAGPPTVIKQIKATQVPSITIADKKSIDGVIADIELLANTLANGSNKPRVKSAAKLLIANIRRDAQAIGQLINAYPRTPKMVFLMDGGTGNNQLMALGGHSAGDAMINIVGGENVFVNDFNSLKPVSNEVMIAKNIDVIMIASRTNGINDDKIRDAIADYPKLAATKAATKGCVFSIGIMQSLGFGPIFSQAALAIAQQIKPCLQ